MSHREKQLKKSAVRVVESDLGVIDLPYLLLTLLRGDSIDLSPVYSDCGSLIFGDEQDAHAGGSGCGCSAAVLCAHLIPGLLAGRWKRVLFCPTGALLSPTSSFQGESIPGICHAVVVSAEKE